MPLNTVSWHDPASLQTLPVDIALIEADERIDTAGKLHLYRAEKYLMYVAARERKQLEMKSKEYLEDLDAEVSEARSELLEASLAGTEYVRPDSFQNQQWLPINSLELPPHVGTLPNHPISDIRGSTSYRNRESPPLERQTNFTKSKEPNRSSPRNLRTTLNSSPKSLQFREYSNTIRESFAWMETNTDATKDDNGWRCYSKILESMENSIDDIKETIKEHNPALGNEEDHLFNNKESIQQLFRFLLESRLGSHGRDLCAECCPIENCYDCKDQRGELCTDCRRTEDCEICDQYTGNLCPKCCQDDTCQECQQYWRDRGLIGRNCDLAAASILSGDPCLRKECAELSISTSVLPPVFPNFPNTLIGSDGHETEEEVNLPIPSLKEAPETEFNLQETELQHTVQSSQFIRESEEDVLGVHNQSLSLLASGNSNKRSHNFDISGDTADTFDTSNTSKKARMNLHKPTKEGENNFPRIRNLRSPIISCKRSPLVTREELVPCPFRCGYNTCAGWQMMLVHIDAMHPDGSDINFEISAEEAGCLKRCKELRSIIEAQALENEAENLLEDNDSLTFQEVNRKRSPPIPKRIPCPFSCGYTSKDWSSMLAHVSSAHRRSMYLDCISWTNDTELPKQPKKLSPEKEFGEEAEQASRNICPPSPTVCSVSSRIDESLEFSDIMKIPLLRFGGPECSIKAEDRSTCNLNQYPLSPAKSMGSSRKRDLDIEMAEATKSKPQKRVRFLEPPTQSCD